MKMEALCSEISGLGNKRDRKQQQVKPHQPSEEEEELGSWRRRIKHLESVHFLLKIFIGKEKVFNLS
jgi:hypothetical protein